MKNKIFLSLGILFLLASPVLALSDLGTFNQFSNITLKQFCNECSFVTLTSVLDPNRAIVLAEVSMDKNGSTYNYFGTNLTHVRGEYIVAGYGDTELDGNTSTFVYTYNVVGTNALRNNLDSPLYIVVFAILFSLSVLLIFFRLFLYSGLLLMILGLGLLFSDFNSIISFIVIGLGVSVVFFQK